MGKVERLIIYTLLAVMAVATFSNRGLIQAKGKPGEATFTKITIVDEAGKTRATLNALALALFDEAGKLRAMLDESALVLDDEAGKGSAMLHGSGLNLYEDDGKFRAILSAHKDGSVLNLYDEEGKFRAMLSAHKDGSVLNLYDEGGKKRAALGSTSLEVTATGTEIKRSPASLVLFDKEGKVIWQTPQD